MRFFAGLALNFGDGDQRCFDAAEVSEICPAAVLCDGANGTPLGGDLAKDAARAVLRDLEQSRLITDERLQEISTDLDRRYPDSGSTLLAAYVQAGSLHLLGVGDSYASLFAFGEMGWCFEAQIDRQVNAFGHPSQLIGAEVPISAIRLERSFSSTHARRAAFLMSDGCGAFLLADDLLGVLSEIGGATPGVEDLNFYASELAHLAISRGSRDDASVVVTWFAHAR